MRTLVGTWVAGVAALALSAAALVVSLTSSIGNDRALVGLLHAALIATPVLVGLYALQREPGSRFALLLIAMGFLFAPSLLAASDNGVAYSIGRIGGWFVELGVVILLLAFPSGLLRGRADRVVAAAAGTVVAALYLPLILLLADYPSPSPWSSCERDCPSNALSVTHWHFAESVLGPLREGMVIVLFLSAAALLVTRSVRASRPMRRTLVPLTAGALLAMAANVAFLVARRVDRYGQATEVLGYVAVAAIPALVIGFAFALLRWRLLASHALRQLTEEFSSASSGNRLRELLAAAIGDESLQIAYWTGDPGCWVDHTGTPVSLPRDDPARAVSEVKIRGKPVAALVHDAAPEVEPTVGEVASGFALMALENMRLNAELRSSLRELRESRARILSAVDYERLRIERDLHDGAQQRLVALRVALEVVSETVRDDPEASLERLAKLSADVEETLDEVRSLARGVYPPLLADHGIGEALRMAARASPLPTTVRSQGVGRYSQQIESAVYFCCLEALQNAAKHSGARSAIVRLSAGDELRFEVQDDGGGFVRPRAGGSGLQNMRDRIVSLGGRLTVESEPGRGTVVIGTIPVGLAQLTPDVEHLFQQATDALEDCFAIYKAVRDSGGEVVDFAVEHLNDAACRDAGRSRESQIGRTLGYLQPGYLQSDLFEWHRQALDADGPSSLEDATYERSVAGRRLRKAYEIRAVPVGGGRLALSWREITDRKLEENELLLQSAILERATEGVCMLRAADGAIVYANPRFTEMFGAAEFSWHEDLGEGTFTQLVRREDGSEFWAESDVTSFEHPDYGKAWVLVHRNVTARKQAQEALRLAEEHMRIAVEGSPLVLYTMDRGLRYTWVLNNQVGGSREDGVIGRTDEELFGREVGRELSRINRRALGGIPVRARVELELAGGPTTVELSVAPLFADGRVVGLAGVAYDLTDRARDGRFGPAAGAVRAGEPPTR
ncbi:MAG TPA: histidine kinase [Thermoleophilaceae bacterium]|nr:histidine kinase [Thermoleophilaceae bacterium]